jgi:hypothetical protein
LDEAQGRGIAHPRAYLRSRNQHHAPVPKGAAEYREPPRRDKFSDGADYREAVEAYRDHMNKKSTILGQYLLLPLPTSSLKDKVIAKRKEEFQKAMNYLDVMKIFQWMDEVMGGSGSVSVASFFQFIFEMDQRKPTKDGNM